MVGQRGLDGIQKFTGVEWLLDEAYRLQRPDVIVRAVLPSYYEDGDCCQMPIRQTELLRAKLPPVHDWHVEVEDDEIRQVFAQFGDRFPTMTGLHNVVTVTGEQISCELP